MIGGAILVFCRAGRMPNFHCSIAEHIFMFHKIVHNREERKHLATAHDALWDEDGKQVPSDEEQSH